MSQRLPCYGRSATGKCKAPATYVTWQAGGVNPFAACGRHLSWLIALRIVPGDSLTVTRLPQQQITQQPMTADTPSPLSERTK